MFSRCFDTAHSDKIYIEIQEPTGDEINARNQWLKINNFYRENSKKGYYFCKDNNIYTTRHERCLKFIEKYPNSVYEKNILSTIPKTDIEKYNYGKLFEKFYDRISIYYIIDKDMVYRGADNNKSNESDEVKKKNIDDYYRTQFANKKISEYSHFKFISSQNIEKRKNRENK